MQRWFRVGTSILSILVVAMLFTAPLDAVAQTQAGIVPGCPVGEEANCKAVCEESDEDCIEAYSPQNYGNCEFVALTNNVLQFIVGLTALIAVIVFVYAGFQMVVSQGNPSKIQKAKSLFTNVLIGFLLILSAFLIVQTIMKVLVGNNSSLLQWQTIDSNCSYANEAGQFLTAIPDSGLGDLEMFRFNEAGEVIGVVTTITTTTGGDITVGGASNDLLQSAAGACEPALVSSVWGSMAGAAQCIIKAESSCGASPISRTDIGADRNPFSFGAMQINTTVHPIRGCGSEGIANLDCPAAWSGRNYNARVVNQGLYEACKAALLNNKCNMINGVRIFKEAGNSWRPWSTAAGCRLR